MIVKEGLAEIEINGAFYNPKMKFCRDADMIVFSKMTSKSYLDALSATGVRGIRAELEANKKSYLNDKNPIAARVIKDNLIRNGLDSVVFNKDANILMREMVFDHVDIDPFGSPAPFIDSACFSAKKCLSVTATDTAALCGSSTNSGLRKYSCFIEKTEFYTEVGLRVLAGKTASEATKYDKALEFVVCWSKEHYYRIHATIKRSPRLSAKVYDNIGYLVYCKKCGWRKSIPIRECKSCKCDFCGNNVKTYGPMWIGSLHNKSLCSKLFKLAKSKGEGKVAKMFKRICEEIDVPFYYDVHQICKKLTTSPPSISKILNKLRDAGFSASRSAFSNTGIKTNADIKVIREILTQS